MTTSPSPLTLALDDPRAANPALTGGKGSKLAQAHAAGLPVPPGFCVTTAAFDLRGTIEADDGLPEVVTDEVLAAFRSLARSCDTTELVLAVRSSAIGEDGAGGSFAGVYESVLGVRDEASLLAALTRVWRSLDSPAAQEYRRRAGLEHAAMAVVVQRLIPCSRAGVLFTIHPLTHDPGRMVVEATWGLGEGVVDSELETDAWELGRSGELVVEARIADKRERVVLSDEPEPSLERVPESLRLQPCLSADELAALRELALRVEASMGGPQDIEWGFDGDTLHLLQTRPITSTRCDRSGARPNNPSAWTALEGPEAKPWLPLDLSLRFRILDGHARALREIGQARLPDHRAIEGYVFAREVDTPEPDLRADRERRHREGLEAHWRRGTTIWEQEIEAEVRAILAPLRTRELGRLTVDELRMHLFDEVLPAYEQLWQLHWLRGRELHGHWYRTFVQLTGIDDELAARTLVASASLVSRIDDAITRLAELARSDAAVRELFASSRGSALLDGLREHAAAGSETASGMLVELEALCAEFPDQGTHRSFSDRIWSEDPALPLDLVRRRVLAGPDRTSTLRAAAERRRDALLAQARAAVGESADAHARLDAALELGRKANREQEDHHIILDLAAHGLVRRALLEVVARLLAAGLLDAEDQLYWLEAPELDAALRALASGSIADLATQLRATIERRRARHEWRLGLRPRSGVAELDWPFFETLEQREASDDARTLIGLAASGGRGRGIVKRMASGQPAPELAEGDVLVARDVGPQWTPLFPILSGLVLDGGALLRHAATIAREYGIPTVIQTRRATELLRDGEVVIVDGDRGVVIRELDDQSGEHQR